MAFKFCAVVILASLAAVNAASVWDNNQQGHQWWRQHDNSNGNAVSSDWRWTGNMNQQMWNQDWQRDQQGQWRWNRNWANNQHNQWNNNNQWNNEWNRHQNQQQQWWNRNWNNNNNENKNNNNRGDNQEEQQWELSYEVRDPRSGDFKSHQESRDGDAVRGQYSMIEADGSRRIVDYTADNENGFNANVRKEGWSRHP